MASPIDRTAARAAFDAYVAPYDTANPRIALKVDHTLRVAELCDRVAASLGMDEGDRDLAWLCGLLHDIGRFEQVRRWNTFSDARSCSHAVLGIEVLFGEGAEGGSAGGLLHDIGRFEQVRRWDTFSDARSCSHAVLGIEVLFGEGAEGGSADGSQGRLEAFAQLDEADRDLLRTAVATHSDFRLPEDLDNRTRQFCDLLRDADKIDILKAVCTEPMEAILGVPEEELLASPLTPAVEETFYAHRTVLRAERRAPADFLLGFACFAFELVYPESRRVAGEQGYLFELFDRPFTNEETARRMAAAREHLREWMGLAG